MAMNDAVIIRRSLTARFFSTVITVVMVAVSVSLILVLLSMRASTRQAFARGSGNMHMLVTRDASPLVAVLNAIFYADPPRQPGLDPSGPRFLHHHDDGGAHHAAK